MTYVIIEKEGDQLLECHPDRGKGTFATTRGDRAGVIVMPAGNPRSQELLEKNGIKVIPVEYDEVMKGYGAIHCCTAF